MSIISARGIENDRSGNLHEMQAPHLLESPSLDMSVADLEGVTVSTAVVFDFTNGFHDTANAMATTIATRALPPRAAVGLAAVLNFFGAFISVTVAATIVMTWVGGLIYQRAIMRTGERVRLRQVLGRAAVSR